MAKITGTGAADVLNGSAGGDLIQGLKGNDTITGATQSPADLLVDGSFETANIGPGTWTHFSSVGGWQSDTGIEIWGKDFIHQASNGDKLMELDYDNRFSKVWQDVSTNAGEQYTISVDTAMRPGTSAATNAINVFWNGEQVGRIVPGSTDWNTETFKVVGTGGNDRLEFREDSGQNDSYGGLIDNVSLKGTLSGNVLIGGTGNDHITAGDNGDVLVGGTLHGDVSHLDQSSAIAMAHTPTPGLHANPTVANDDTLMGGKGNDTLLGMNGNDILNGGGGNNYVDGGSGNDRIVAGGGNDTIVGGSGFDTVDFSNATHSVTVNLAQHSATGFGTDAISGIEAIIGSNYGDSLTGNSGDNLIVGGAGNDVIHGGRGSDSLTGGAGADHFVWARGDIGHGVDTVTDFGNGQDVLDLRAVFRGQGGDHASKIQIVDTAAGSEVMAKIHGQFVEVAMLENVHHESVGHMMQAGLLLA